MTLIPPRWIRDADASTSSKLSQSQYWTPIRGQCSGPIDTLTMSDRIAVFNRGRIEQIGTGSELYERPATLFVSSFIGEANQITGAVLRSGTQNAIAIAGTPIILPSSVQSTTASLVLRSENIKRQNEHEQTDGYNCISWQVEEVLFMGRHHRYIVRLADDSMIKANRAPDDLPLPYGSKVSVRWRVEHGHAFAS